MLLEQINFLEKGGLINQIAIVKKGLKYPNYFELPKPNRELCFWDFYSKWDQGNTDPG